MSDSIVHEWMLMWDGDVPFWVAMAIGFVFVATTIFCALIIEFIKRSWFACSSHKFKFVLLLISIFLCSIGVVAVLLVASLIGVINKTESVAMVPFMFSVLICYSVGIPILRLFRKIEK